MNVCTWLGNAQPPGDDDKDDDADSDSDAVPDAKMLMIMNKRWLMIGGQNMSWDREDTAGGTEP